MDKEVKAILGYSIYTTLIGYKDSNGYTIPAKVREQMKEEIIAKIEDGFKKYGYTISKEVK